MKRRVKIKISKTDVSYLLQIVNLMTSDHKSFTDIVTMAMNAAFRDMAEELQYRVFFSGESERITMKFSECSAIFFFGAFSGDALVGASSEKLVADRINRQIEEQLFKSGRYKFPQK